MNRDAATRISLCRRMAAWRKQRDTDRSEAARSALEHTAVVIHTLHARTQRGEATTLRQLHKAAQLTQPQALKTLADLERAGLVEIDRNNVDAFESTITLNAKIKERMATISLKDAA